MYATEAVSRLRFVKRAQALGFTLGKIKELFALGADHYRRCGEVRAQVEHTLADVLAKSAAWKKIERTLKRLHNSCNARLIARDGPILRTLAAGLVA